MAIITITSDYGTRDPYGAALKGRLYRDFPEALICDITPDIEPGDHLQAGFILRYSYREFPEGTVHLVAVGEWDQHSRHRWLVAELGGHYLVLPDHGLLSLIQPQQHPTAVYELTWRPEEEETRFPARDLLAPAAAHLARGGKPNVLGRPVQDWQVLTGLKPQVSQSPPLILGSVAYIDSYGNLLTTISRELFERQRHGRAFTIELPRQQRITKLHQHYGEVSEGKVLALFNSMGLLEIAVKDPQSKKYSGAHSLLGLEVRDSVRVVFRE